MLKKTKWINRYLTADLPHLLRFQVLLVRVSLLVVGKFFVVSEGWQEKKFSGAQIYCLHLARKFCNPSRLSVSFRGRGKMSINLKSEANRPVLVPLSHLVVLGLLRLAESAPLGRQLLAQVWEGNVWILWPDWFPTLVKKVHVPAQGLFGRSHPLWVSPGTKKQQKIQFAAR